MKKNHLTRVRRYCVALPEVTEKISHGEPTFFVKKKVFVMYADNHHNDGRTAIWCAASAGVQEMLIEAEPEKFFKPPYVGVRGWIGIKLDQVNDDELASHIRQAWLTIAPAKLHTALKIGGES